MQPTGINPSLIRILPSTSPELLTELLTPGKVLDADVVSVFQDRAILSFGRGVRLEVALQAPLQEGQRVRVQVQAQPGPGAPPAAAQQAPAQAGPELPAPVPQAPVFLPRPNFVVQAPIVMTEMPSLVTTEGEQALIVPQDELPAPQAGAAAAPTAEPVVPGQAPVGQQQPATEPLPDQAAIQTPQQAPPQAEPAATQPQQAAPQPEQTTPQPQQMAPQAQETAPQPQQTAPQVPQAAPQPQQQGLPQPQPATAQPAAPQPAQGQPAAAQPGQAAPQAQQQAPAERPAPTPQPAASAPTTVSAFVARQAAGLGTGPQQLLRPIALPQPGAPAAQPQSQTQTAAARQPIPTPTPAPTPTGNPPPVVLKVIATLPPREAAPTGTVAPTADQPAAAAKATGAGAAAVREALTPTSGQPAPVTNQQPAQQANAAQVFWLPIPLPDGKQGWAQLHIQEDDSPKARSTKGGPTHEVRIWWETPSLGAVQVTLDAAADKLAALFTAAAPESKGALESFLPELQRRLSQVGFPEARVGCRTAAPGEAVEPARAQGASRLDKRL